MKFQSKLLNSFNYKLYLMPKKEHIKQYNPSPDFLEVIEPPSPQQEQNRIKTTEEKKDYSTAQEHQHDIQEEYYQEDIMQRNTSVMNKKRSHRRQQYILLLSIFVWFILILVIKPHIDEQGVNKNQKQQVVNQQEDYNEHQIAEDQDQEKEVNDDSMEIWLKNYKYLFKGQKYEKQVISLRGQSFQAWKTTRPAVTNISQTLIPFLQYLRPTKSQIYLSKNPQQEQPTPQHQKQQNSKQEQIQFIKLKNKQQFTQYMKKRFNISLSIDAEKMGNLSATRSPNQYMKFFNQLRVNPNDRTLIEAQYHLYNSLYNISESRLSDEDREKSLCVVSVGRQTFSHSLQNTYLQSLARQNYTKFKVIYIDDASEDMSLQTLYIQLCKKHPTLLDKFILIRNQNKLGAFANKDSAIKENCHPNDIVVEIDADDQLIGRQAFQVLNSLYQQKQEGQRWVVYSNYLMTKSDGSYQLGISRKLKVASSQYRLEGMYWATSHLKTYYAWLEMKIPIDYLLNQEGDYPQYSSDLSMMFSLIELAGDQRVYFIKQLLYSYHKIANTEPCARVKQKFDGAFCRAKLPQRKLVQRSSLVEISENTEQKKERIAQIEYNISTIEEKVGKCLQKDTLKKERKT